MPTRFTGRVILTLLVVLAALWALFPDPTKLLDPEIPWSQKLNLKPGIDMVGGSSLLYEIKPPEGTTYSGDLVEQVMQPLKRRVDPTGTMNLIWRPQGETRLEIQMPLLAGAEEAEGKRQALIEAQRALEATNVSPAEVVAVVEGLGNYKVLTPAARQQKLDELAMGSPQRQALFKELTAAYEQLQAARQRQDVQATVAAEDAYRAAQAKIEETNLTVAELEQDLALPPDARQKELDAHLKQAEGFPARKEAIQKLAGAYTEFARVRDLVDNVADLKRKLKGAGVLSFHIVAEDLPAAERAEYEQRLASQGPRARAGDRAVWVEVDRPEEYQGQTREYAGKHYLLVYNAPDVNSENPKVMDNRQGVKPWHLKQARVTTKDQYGGEQVVGFTFDAQGGEYFGRLTGANVQRPMATVLDGRVISVANINSRIGESGIIEGGGNGFTKAELDYMVSTFNAGSLPAQLTEEPISERTIGPQLGKQNLKRALNACYFGIVVVGVFLIGYYYRAGAVAFLAVLLNLLFILGAMALLNATFTLPAVAGVILTIGMAVDANVLIFERLREEQVRGLSLRMALRNAYDKAWTAILDSNVTTGITAAILYVFGSEEVKGFGLTLLIGIISSLFTSLFVTKTVFGLWLERFGLERLGSLPLTFPRWDRALRPNIDWMSKAKYFYAFSTVVIVVGLVAFVARFAQGRVLDVEFTSGTSVQFELKDDAVKPPDGLDQDKVRDLVEAYSRQHPDLLPSPYVVSVGTDGKSYEVVTTNENSAQVRDAVIAALRDPNNPAETLLELEEPSNFKMVGEALDKAMAQNVVAPIRSADQQVAGFVPGKLAAHVGGVAVVLENLNPPIDPDAIKDRLDRQRLQGDQRQAAGVRFDVERAPQPGTVIVLASDRSFPYETGDPLKLQQWTEEVAAPAWRLTNEAVNKPAGLQRVSNFNPQVAGETQRDAIVAMTISILGIMAYIWMRFGNLKYGSATVIALLHDTLVVLAAIGIAHYLSEVAFLRAALALEPFRINLTMIAAILTVMGWSMNDTVVVFDRIRENRGRYGLVSRQIINDSINQTLSRTLLTGSTTILTIFVMYVWGGPGVHGFTFALLVGILVGTYSSIAIASPLLLLGSHPLGAPAAGPARAAGQLQRA